MTAWHTRSWCRAPSPAGRIAAIDTDALLRMPGVIAVLSHDNAPRLSPVKRFPLDTAGWLFTFGTAALTLLPLQDDRIRFAGQPVALVVAETFEQATDAANAVSTDPASRAHAA